MNASAPSAAIPASFTSFSQLFGRNIEDHVILEIEIPLIQRDYAQGRKTEKVARIRENFLDALCSALLPDANVVDLDFVFGDVEETKGKDRGRFYPLDGQQRLTTLFLLHCYLAWRTGTRPDEQPWSHFSYATRPGARDFCQFLVRCQPEFSSTISLWIKDHADYLPTWQHDPTIQSMLVVLDALHDWCVGHDLDSSAAWKRLIHPENPAIRFHVLPMRANGLTDALYIKMNSRGKPLTAFENFKAHFEDVLKSGHLGRAKEFAQKIDTDWSDILWPYRGDDCLIDDEFQRYFRFITEVCAWRNGIEFRDSTRDDALAESVYGAGATNAANSLDFLFQAWDVWKGKNIQAEFQRLLTVRREGTTFPLLVFHPSETAGVDLFRACCQCYGVQRQWTLADTLTFYGILLGLIHHIPDGDFARRLRVLRNLIEASRDEIRTGERNSMPRLLGDVETIVVVGDLKNVGTFNQVQLRNEEAKSDLLAAAPGLVGDLYILEDHDLLRGGLTAFNFDPDLFAQRAQAFAAVFDKASYSGEMPWKMVACALLATGDYSRRERRWTGSQAAAFGAPKKDEPWQELFRGKKGESVHPVRESLTSLLDAVIAGYSLQSIVENYLDDPKTLKDWRYYFVKYEVMRHGASGRYTISQSGYQACMLDKERMSSNYYDPYLFAAASLAQIPLDRIADRKWPRGFTGDENARRVLVLERSGLNIECVDVGWQISEFPCGEEQKALFEEVCKAFGVGSEGLYSVPQVDGVDSVDRIEAGAELLGILIDQGF